MITIYKPGTTVKIHISGTKAIINRAIVSTGEVTYEASYFTGEDFKSVDLYDYEFEVVHSNGTDQIGFK